MNEQMTEAVEILRRTPATLRVLLGGLPADRGGESDREDWGAGDVLGHLIHGEATDWVPRARIILQHGESRPFEPFDRFAQFELQGQTTEDLLEMFERARASSLDSWAQLGIREDQWELRGTHPELGTVTLRQLLATWAVHDLNHIRQVAEAMARPYQVAVGPWKAYLPILDGP